jgi:hypothetical protein
LIPSTHHRSHAFVGRADGCFIATNACQAQHGCGALVSGLRMVLLLPLFHLLLIIITIIIIIVLDLDPSAARAVVIKGNIESGSENEQLVGEEEDS